MSCRVPLPVYKSRCSLSFCRCLSHHRRSTDNLEFGMRVLSRPVPAPSDSRPTPWNSTSIGMWPDRPQSRVRSIGTQCWQPPTVPHHPEPRPPRYEPNINQGTCVGPSDKDRPLCLRNRGISPVPRDCSASMVCCRLTPFLVRPGVKGTYLCARR